MPVAIFDTKMVLHKDTPGFDQSAYATTRHEPVGLHFADANKFCFHQTNFAGAVYHLTSRGNARQKIFLNDVDRELFLRALPVGAMPLNRAQSGSGECGAKLAAWKWSSYRAAAGVVSAPSS
jgi:hypothetical protein